VGAARHHGQRLLPGIVGTAMWDFLDEKLGKFMGNEKGETLQQMSQLIALGRVLSASSDRRETAASLAGTRRRAAGPASSSGDRRRSTRDRERTDRSLGLSKPFPGLVLGTTAPAWRRSGPLEQEVAGATPFGPNRKSTASSNTKCDFTQQLKPVPIRPAAPGPGWGRSTP
jgi:hypothetical protein